MKKSLTVALALLAVLALGGCAAEADNGTDDARVASGSTAQEPDAPAEHTPAPPARFADEVSDADSVFLAAVHDGAIIGLDALTDSDLVDAGLTGCAQLASGQNFDELEPITGDSAGELVPGANDRNITAIASQTLCPSYDVTVER